MAAMKRKVDEQPLIDRFGDHVHARADFVSTGLSTYISAAIQYPLLTGRGTLVKLLIGALFALLPVAGFFILTGYSVRAMRRIMKRDYALPDWYDFVGDFLRGIVVWICLIVFGLLLALSTLLVVTIPIVLVFGFPMAGYTVARYAATGDPTVFLDVSAAYRAVLAHFADAVLMLAGSLAVSIVFSLLISFGALFLFIPGVMMAVALMLALSFNIANFSRAAVR